MFLIDKYAPKSVKDSKFHNELLNLLHHMSGTESIPHILISGPNGSGKKTIIKLLLEMLYDSNVHKEEDTVYKVIGSGNKAIDVVVKQSDYHIVIEPNNNNFDRYLIQDIVKEYAKKIPLGVFKTKKIFRTVLINNIDNMSYYAQTSLRRTMEKYHKTCRFIMFATCPTRVIKPLISRCIFFSLSLPSNPQLFGHIYEIAIKEGLRLSLKEYTYILDKAKGNIKEALWLLELYRLNCNKINAYDDTIAQIGNMIIKHDLSSINVYVKGGGKNDKDDVVFIRDLIYNIMITNISGSKIIKDLTDNLCDNPNIPDDCKYEIIRIMALYEYNIPRSRRFIVHVEAAIIEIMQMLYLYEQNKQQKQQKNNKN